MQLNKVCALWKYTEQWASGRSNGFQRKFFESLYTFKHTNEQSMHSVEVNWVLGLKQKQWVSKEIFQNIIHLQTYTWTKYAFCESTLNGGLQAEAMGFRRSFSKHYTHSNIQLNKVCAARKYSEWWASSRSNGFQKKFFKTLYTFKYTLEQSMPSVNVHWVVGFKQKQWLAEEVFFKQYLHANIQLNKVCALWNYTEWLASSRSNGFQKFYKTFYIFKHTIEQNMHCVKVQWVLGFKHKQRLSEEIFWNIIHIQTCNWTKYAFCGSKLSVGPQAEAMGFERNFSKHYTPSNIHMNKVCLLWKYTEWWASSRSNGFQKKFFKTLYTFKHTIEQSMRCAKVQWVVGFKQKQWVSEEVFQNIIHIQIYTWTKYAFCKCTLSGGLQAEAMASRRSFFQTIFTCKHTTEQSMRSVELHWVVGFKQKQWLPEILQNILHIQTYNWTKYALCESTVSVGLQAQAKAFWRNFLKHYTHSNMQLNKVCALWKYTEQWASGRSNGFQRKFFESLYTFKHTIEQSMHSVKVNWVLGLKQKQWVSKEVFQNSIHNQTYNWTIFALCESTLSG